MKTYKFLALPVMVAILALGSFGAMASAQTAMPRLQIQLGSNGLTNPLVASTSAATVARLALNTTGSSEGVRISSLPFILTTGGGALASSLMNCRIYNEADPNVSLNTPSSATASLSNGVNNIMFNSQLVLAANTVTTLALRCDVSGNLVAGGTYTFSMNSANVVATGATTGLPAFVTVPGGSVVVPPVVIPPVVPGLPVTGGNGDIAKNLLTLTLVALALSSVGFVYLDRQAKRS